MEGRLLIDGVDVFKTYGVYVTQGGWNELVSMPNLKEITKNDWQEEDGIEADLTAPVLDTKNVSVKFCISTEFDRHFEFLSLLSKGAYHTFECISICRTFKLRMISANSLTLSNGIGLLTIRFANDFPLMGYSYNEPMSGLLANDRWILDNRPLTDYGCRLLLGTISEVTKPSEAKQNLLQNYKAAAGANYDSERVTFKSKDVKLNCLMTANTLEELWRNYDALLYDLTRPNERILYNSDIEHGFPFYYKSCQVQEFLPTECWIRMTLIVVFTHDFTKKKKFVLASENGFIIITEDSEKEIEITNW